MTNVSYLTWDTARAAGFVAYLLVAASVALGLVLSLRWRGGLWTRFVTTELHRFVTLLSIVFMAVHGVAVLVDPYIKFSPAEVLVPLVSHYRPIWMALGIVAGYLLVAIWLSERIQRRIGYAWWRRLHYLTFVIYALVTVHGIATGSDTKTTWGLLVYGGPVVVIAWLLAVRLLGEGPHETVRGTMAALGVALVAAVAVWTWSGPLRPGWSAAAGGTLLTAGTTGTTGTTASTTSGAGTGSQTVAGVQAPPPPAPRALAAIRSRFNGQFDPQSSMLSASLADGTSLSLQLSGSADGEGGLLISAAQATIQEPGQAPCQGTLQATEAGLLTGTCSSPAGQTMNVQISLRGEDDGGVRGVFVATPA